MLSTLAPFVESISSLKIFFYPQTSHLKVVTSRIKLAKCENRRLSWVMITVSSITKIHTYRNFYIPVNFDFKLPHYVPSQMHHTGKKESKKDILKKQK